MAKAKILSVEQTEKAGLFTICFEGEILTEFGKFIQKFKDDAICKHDLQVIVNALHRMLQTSGFIERMFRPEGKIKNNVCALPIETSKLRLYCLRLSELNGYVISLQKLDALIKVAVRSGDVTIEETVIEGINDKEFEL